MKKFVFLNQREGYQKCIYNAVKDQLDAEYFEPISNSFGKKLWAIFGSYHLNRGRKNPLHMFMYKRCLKGMNLQENDEVYFLLYESFNMTYSVGFLKYLRKKYPLARLCMVLSNNMNNYLFSKINVIKEHIDCVLAFDSRDAEKYNYPYLPNQPYKIDTNEGSKELKSDIFFVGSNKGRLDILIKIYEKMTAHGLVCDFHIMGVEQKYQKYSDNIIYNQIMNYEDVLKHAVSTKCILEVVQKDTAYTSIRTTEALQLKKKLLTNSQAAKKLDCYNEKIIQIFENPDEIKPEFVREEVKDDCFQPNKHGDYEEFKKRLVSIFENNYNKAI